jgi:membrane protein implicated in regulation of membrane protease activity
MSPFWGSFFDHFRVCGRNATLFLLALVGFFIVLIAAAVASHLNLFQYAGPIFAAAGLIIAIRAGVAMYQARRRPRERFKRHPLSSDEARVARSKLLRRRVSNGWQQQN